MEEKKFDVNSLIGFVLIGAILVWMLYLNKPTEEEMQAEKAKTEAAAKERLAAEQVESKEVTIEEATQELSVANTGDSLALDKLKNRLGSFAYSGTLPSATNATTVLENEVLALTISNKGGYIIEARLKEHSTYDSIPVFLIKDGNASFNLMFSSENRLLNSEDLFFEPSLSNNGDNRRSQ